MDARVFWTALLLATAVQAGVVARYVESGKPETLYVEGNKLRIESPDRILIYDGNAKQMIEVNQGQRTYSVTTESDMREAGKKLQTQMQEQVKNLPPDQRKAWEDAMRKGGTGGAGAGEQETKARYVRSGNKRKIAGHECEMYQVTRGDSREQECILPWSAGVVKKSDFDVFKSMSQFMGQLSAGMGMKMSAKEEESGFREVLDAPGVPLMKTTDGSDTKEEMKSIERAQVSSDKFSPPTGYAKKPSQMLQQMRGGKE